MDLLFQRGKKPLPRRRADFNSFAAGSYLRLKTGDERLEVTDRVLAELTATGLMSLL